MNKVVRKQTMEQNRQKKLSQVFIDFTKRALAQESRALEIAWEDQMNMLYGDAESRHITGNKIYDGVPGIKESLVLAYVTGGLPGLKFEFLQQTLEHTEVKKKGDATLIAFQRIIGYK